MNGLELKLYRKERKITQKELCEMTGATEKVIKNWEQGISPIPEMFVRLLKCIEVSNKGTNVEQEKSDSSNVIEGFLSHLKFLEEKIEAQDALITQLKQENEFLKYKSDISDQINKL